MTDTVASGRSGLSFGEFRAHFGDGLRGDFGEGLFRRGRYFEYHLRDRGLYDKGSIKFRTGKRSADCRLRRKSGRRRLWGGGRPGDSRPGGESSTVLAADSGTPPGNGETALRRRFHSGAVRNGDIFIFAAPNEFFMLRVSSILWAASSTFDWPAVHPAVAVGRGLFVVRGPDLPLGVASLCLGAYGLLAGAIPPREGRELGTVFLLSLLPRRDVAEPGGSPIRTSPWVASTIHFM